MTVNYTLPHSPQPSLIHSHLLNPTTPAHSPHPSLSSTSSSMPHYTISRHEYRKQQNTPTSLSSTPPGKTLRRKPASSALNDLERAPSLSRTPDTTLQSPFRAPHYSYSSQHLPAYQPLSQSTPFQQQPEVQERPPRSHSAEPLSLAGRDGHYQSTGQADHFCRAFNSLSPQKVRNWKPIKRLPNPTEVQPSANHHVFRPSFVHHSSSLASVMPAPPRSSPDQTCSSTGNRIESGEQATRPTFSLSRFPKPPPLFDLSCSPPSDGNVAPRVDLTFITTAPAITPATPATLDVVHYRGTLLDVVNSHDSLLLRDIEDSPDHLLPRSSVEPFFQPEMAPQRPLNEDFSEAFKSIAKLPDETPNDRASAKEKDGIPFIWTRRSSGNFATHTKSGVEESPVTADLKAHVNPGISTDRLSCGNEEKDWETINPSPGKSSKCDSLKVEMPPIWSRNSKQSSRPISGESTADYSDDSDVGQLSPEGSSHRHLSPLPAHENPFTLLSPGFRVSESVNSFPNGGFSSPCYPALRTSTTVPLFQSRLSYRNRQYYDKPVPNFGQLSDRETQELLNSGPNEDIIYEKKGINGSSGSCLQLQSTTTIGNERENTFEKLTLLGPKKNLTGTPHGTGMKEVGSSVADSSSSGAEFSSPPGRLSRPFFFPFSQAKVHEPRTRSPLSNEATTSAPEHLRKLSAQTLFPKHIPSSSNASKFMSDKSRNSSRQSIKAALTPTPKGSRPNVTGQTKLREMIFVTENTIISSADSTPIPHFMGDDSNEAPSSARTSAPLRPPQPLSLLASIRDEHPPHLLYAERILSPELEEEQLKKSKVIFFCFCILPPLLLLYAVGRADGIMAVWSKGKIDACHPRYKRLAKWTAGVSSVVIVLLIIVPILAVQGAGGL